MTQPPAPEAESARLVKSLLRRSRQGSLATLTPGSGDPYCSLVNVASHPHGSPILLISRLALHTRNVLGDARVSLMLDERAQGDRTQGDPLQGARIMLAGKAVEADDAQIALLRCRYLNVHPSAEMFVDFKDFSFFRIEPAQVHLVAGFGRIVNLTPAEFLTDVSDAANLLEAERDAIEHMNADHRDTMNLYATKLLGAESADWHCTGLDPDGIDLAFDSKTLRLAFPRRIVSSVALRQMLKELADQARTRSIPLMN